MPVLVISDDIKWCKQNLSYLFKDIKFNENTDILFDFYCLSLSKSNICSPSSFSVLGSILNENKDIVICDPYYSNPDMKTSIIPIYFKKANFELYSKNSN